MFNQVFTILININSNLRKEQNQGNLVAQNHGSFCRIAGLPKRVKLFLLLKPDKRTNSARFRIGIGLFCSYKAISWSGFWVVTFWRSTDLFLSI